MSQGYTKLLPIDTDGTLSQNSDFVVSSQKAVKTYVDTEINAENLQTIYDKSTPTAEIVTDATRGAVTVKSGVNDSSRLLEFKNTLDVVNAFITAVGGWTGVNITNSGVFSQLQTRPAQITSDQNNYTTTGTSFLFLTSDASRTITGFANGTDGKYLTIYNGGGFDIIVAHQNTSSLAANRVITGNAGANITIPPDECITLFRDSTAQRWRLLSKSF